MSDEFKEKLRSLSFQGDRRGVAPKVTTDVHDHHEVDVTEHWSERVDVLVKPDTVRYKIQRED